MTDWTVHLRRPDLTREGQLDDFADLQMITRFNATGTWSISVNANASLAEKLAMPQWGIEVVHNPTGQTVLSGSTRLIDRERSGDTNKWEIAGYDDNVWLDRRVVKPQPATAAPPYNSSEYDVRTGTGSTILREYVNVNAGPGATSDRRVFGLTLGTDPVAGSSVTGRGRWQKLLELLQQLAQTAGGLGFRVIQVGAALEFQVYTPTDRSATVQFAVELGTLGGYRYSTEVSKVNYLYVGGGGEGTARTIKERGDTDEISTWGRIEDFADRRDTTVDAELAAEGDKRLAEGVGAKSLSMVPVDTAGQGFLTGYNLGDICTGIVDGVLIPDVIREVSIKLTPDGPTVIAPQIGTPDAPAITPPGLQDSPVPRIFRRLLAAEQRLRLLERR